MCSFVLREWPQNLIQPRGNEHLLCTHRWSRFCRQVRGDVLRSVYRPTSRSRIDFTAVWWTVDSLKRWSRKQRRNWAECGLRHSTAPMHICIPWRRSPLSRSTPHSPTTVPTSDTSAFSVDLPILKPTSLEEIVLCLAKKFNILFRNDFFQIFCSKLANMRQSCNTSVANFSLF